MKNRSISIEISVENPTAEDYYAAFAKAEKYVEEMSFSTVHPNGSMTDDRPWYMTLKFVGASKIICADPDRSQPWEFNFVLCMDGGNKT